MTVVENIRTVQFSLPTVLTIGSFDGVHRGHLRILEAVVQSAQASGCVAATLTMQR